MDDEFIKAVQAEYDALPANTRAVIDRHTAFMLNVIEKRIAATADVVEKAIDVHMACVNHKKVQDLD